MDKDKDQGGLLLLLLLLGGFVFLGTETGRKAAKALSGILLALAAALAAWALLVMARRRRDGGSGPPKAQYNAATAVAVERIKEAADHPETTAADRQRLAHLAAAVENTGLALDAGNLSAADQNLARALTLASELLEGFGVPHGLRDILRGLMASPAPSTALTPQAQFDLQSILGVEITPEGEVKPATSSLSNTDLATGIALTPQAQFDLQSILGVEITPEGDIKPATTAALTNEELTAVATQLGIGGYVPALIGPPAPVTIPSTGGATATPSPVPVDFPNALMPAFRDERLMVGKDGSIHTVGGLTLLELQVLSNYRQVDMSLLQGATLMGAIVLITASGAVVVGGASALPASVIAAAGAAAPALVPIVTPGSTPPPISTPPALTNEELTAVATQLGIGGYAPVTTLWVTKPTVPVIGPLFPTGPLWMTEPWDREFGPWGPVGETWPTIGPPAPIIGPPAPVTATPSQGTAAQAWTPSFDELSIVGLI